ncbi:MAG: leucine-rich repeat domain-containing protein [Erysipelotrichaceae bacterium]|nr:leucine-rich repeat domain-containing protein [Erysipelotrichaceae bacterium]
MNKKGYIFTICIFGVAIIVLAILVGIKLSGEDFTKNEKKSDEYIYYSEMFSLKLSNDKTYYSITKLKNTSLTSVEIPDTIDNIPVKKILANKDSNNFTSWNNCITIRIGKNIEYIGTEEDNNGVLNGGTLGDNFLSSISKTSTIIVDEENPVYASRDGVLYNKDFTVLIRYPNNKIDSIESFNVVIPDTVVTIYNRAFYYNDKITKLVLGKNVEHIGNLAFTGCTKLSTITFNDKLKSIGQAAFKDCDFTSIKLPETVQSLSDLCFAFNYNLDYCYIGKNCMEFGRNIFSEVSKNFIIVTSSDNLTKLQELEVLKQYQKRAED